jgi:hypothetical protein
MTQSFNPMANVAYKQSWREKVRENDRREENGSFPNIPGAAIFNRTPGANFIRY